MTTRKRKPKPKPAYLPDRPAEQPRLAPVTIEPKQRTRAAQAWLDMELLLQSLPQAKMTLH